MIAGEASCSLLIRSILWLIGAVTTNELTDQHKQQIMDAVLQNAKVQE